MGEPDIDIVGIGNAIVDVISHADDAFLDRHGLVKGSMSLVDADQAGRLYEAMGPGLEMSGGSAANTIAGIASFGGAAAFVGKVSNDQLGQVFGHDIRSLGVHFDTPAARGGANTGRCLVLVTPDAQRTMNTYLGAATDLRPADIDPELIARAGVTYLEGYLWDPPHAKDAFRKAASIARGAGRKVALTLSDAFCVDRYRAEFRELVSGGVDILFANEAELLSLYEVDDFDAGMRAIRNHCAIAALTRSEKGSVVVHGDETHFVDAVPVDPVVDTTGAGDLYAAGFLFGYTAGKDLAACGRLGSLAAGEVISHLGARPDRTLRTLL